MNRSIFLRLFWKEYRHQRAFWLCAAAVGAAGIFLVSYALPDDANIHVYWLASFYTIAFLQTGLYALGCSAMLFAAEREAGTDALLQSLPLSSRQLFLGKIGFALFGIFAMLCLTCVLAGWRTAWEMIEPNEILDLFTNQGLLVIDIFLGGFAFSLFIKRPLVAAVLGGLIAFIIPISLAFLLDFNRLYPSEDMMHISIYYHLFYEIMMIALISRLGAAWLHGRLDCGLLSSKSGFRMRHKKGSIKPPSCRNNRPALKRIVVFSRLVWQHWRLSRKMLLLFVLLTIPLAFILFQTWINGYLEQYLLVLVHRVLPATINYISLPLCVPSLLSLGLVPLMGTAVFNLDNRESVRFLSEHSVSPRLFWLSRQISAWVAGFISILIFFAILLLLVFINNLSSAHPESHGDFIRRLHDDYSVDILMNITSADVLTKITLTDILPFVKTPIYIVILGLSAGQFCSMLFRGGIIAGLFSCILTFLLVCWCELMDFLGVPWLWSVAPIPLLLLLATWLRAPCWLWERNNPRSWLKPAFALFISGSLIMAAVPYYRMTEIPLIDPGFPTQVVDAPASSEQQTAINLYKDAWTCFVRNNSTLEKSYDSPAYIEKTKDRFEPMTPVEILVANHRTLNPRQIACVNANQDTIALTLKASGVSFDNYPFSLIGDQFDFHIIILCDMLFDSAMQLEEKGNLEEALDRYLAVMKIAEQLRYLLPQWYSSAALEERVCIKLSLWAARPNQTPERIAAALCQLERLTGYLDAGRRTIIYNYFDMFAEIYSDEDASKTRNMLSWNYETRVQYELSKLWLSLPWERTRAVRLLNIMAKSDMANIHQLETEGLANKQISDPRSSTYITPAYEQTLARDVCLLPQSKIIFDTTLIYKRTVTRRRATHVLLALQAWKLQNGSLPNSLQELVGPYLDVMPMDPYTGKRFHYLQNGFERAAHWSENSGDKILPPRLPLIYSDGANIDFNTDREDLPYHFDEYMSPWEYRHVGEPISQPEAWRSSFVFPIP
jgi:ABC-type transport system involved in multi-copper enzyme maturation permease subunit